MLTYRKCAAIIVIKNNLVFVGERVDTKDAWQFPQGGINENETAIDAAKRELHEETNMESVEFLCQTANMYSYDFTEESQEKALKKNGVIKYKGQNLAFCVFKFTGEDSEINIHKNNAEFCNWKWTTLNSVLEKIVSFKKDAYQNAINELRQSKDLP